MKRGIIAIVLALLLLVACSPAEQKMETQTPTAQETLPPTPQYEPPPTAPDAVESETTEPAAQ